MAIEDVVAIAALRKTLSDLDYQLGERYKERTRKILEVQRNHVATWLVSKGFKVTQSPLTIAAEVAGLSLSIKFSDPQHPVIGAFSTVDVSSGVNTCLIRIIRADHSDPDAALASFGSLSVANRLEKIIALRREQITEAQDLNLDFWFQISDPKVRGTGVLPKITGKPLSEAVELAVERVAA